MLGVRIVCVGETVLVFVEDTGRDVVLVDQSVAINTFETMNQVEKEETIGDFREKTFVSFQDVVLATSQTSVWAGVVLAVDDSLPLVNLDAFVLKEVIVFLAQRTDLIQSVLDAELNPKGVRLAEVFRQVVAVLTGFTDILVLEVAQTVFDDVESNSASVVLQEVVLLAITAFKVLRREGLLLNELHAVFDDRLLDAIGV